MSDAWGQLEPSSALQIVLESGRLLKDYGFLEIPVGDIGVTFPDEAVVRVYEDPVSFVGVVGFPDWPRLVLSWVGVQEALGTLIGRRVNSSDAKAWDTYLVLVVEQELTPSDHADAVEIRYNTRRARKIIVVGGELRSPEDLELALMPVRPVVLGGAALAEADPLEDLVDHVEGQGGGGDTRVLVDAFRESRLLMESLHEWRSSQ